MDNFLFALTAFETQSVIFATVCIPAIISLVYLWHTFQSQFSRSTKIFLIIVSFFLWAATGYAGLQMVHRLTAVPHIRRIVPRQGETINPLAPDVHILFDAPVRVGSISVHTFPEIDFTVRPSGYFWNLSPWATQITLVPKTTVPTGEHFMVYLANIEGPFTRGYGGEQLLEVMTPETAITDISPSDNSRDVSDTQSFTLHSTTVVDEQEWSVRLDPATDMTITKVNSKTLRITPDVPLRQSTSYTMTIIHTPTMVDRATGDTVEKLESNTKMTLHFTTVHAAFVSTFVPAGNGVNPASDMRITFEEPMDKTSVIKHITISPAADLRPAWGDDDKTLSLTHSALAKDTDYTVTFTAGLTTVKGGTLEKDTAFQFRTAGQLTVTNVSPVAEATDVSADSSILFTFDQNVPQSIVNQLVIVPNVSGNTIVNGKTFEFTPKNPLSFETKYSVTLTAGAKSDYGLPTLTDKTFTFTTAPNQITLPVPYYKQQTLFTCNISAARMLLAYRGVNVTEGDLIDVIGLGGKRGTGNPYKGYVDDFGTYWDAIVRGVSKYRSTRLITSGKLSDIIAEVKKGNPVMTWGQNGWSDPHDISWTSTDGTFIKAVNGMHSAVVRGYSGPDTNPTQIFLNDPWRGQYAIPTAEFLRRWSYVGMAMVVD
jgi:uncharacterized protein YvpB